MVPVPDGSRPAAIQISAELGLPYREGLVKNRWAALSAAFLPLCKSLHARTVADSSCFMSEGTAWNGLCYALLILLNSRIVLDQVASRLIWVVCRYVGRTFIMPDQRTRELSVRRKLNAMPAVFEGKSVLLVDDSIVRGTTMSQIVDMVRKAGAKKVSSTSAFCGSCRARTLCCDH